VVDGGDSGGAVWWYDGHGGIVMIGFVDAYNGQLDDPGQIGYFNPVWD